MMLPLNPRWNAVAALIVVALLPPARTIAQSRPPLGPQVRAFVSVDAPTVALTHVRLVDGTGAPARDDQTVVISGARIAAVGPTATTAVPSGATVLDLAGHTVTPGLVGLHEHTYFGGVTRMRQMTVSGPRAYLAMGVTTIRTAGSQFPYEELNGKRAVDKGEAAGPRMHITGPYLNGPNVGTGTARGLASVEEARRVVAYWAEEGATWLKLQGSISREIAGAVIQEAHQHGMKVTGHLCSLSYADAAALGIDALEHGFITNSEYVPGKQPDVCPEANMRVQADVDEKSPAVQASIRNLVNHKVALSSTLAVYETFVPERARLNARAMELLAPDTRAEVEATHAALGKDGFAVPVRLIEKMMAWERDFVAAGGLLGAGVDPWGTGMLPGFGDLRNYEMLTEAGFSGEQAIQIMTLNGARILGEDARLGSVAAGKLADLVVIKGDPVRTHADIYSVVTVFKDGVGYDSAKLLASIKGMVGIR